MIDLILLRRLLRGGAARLAKVKFFFNGHQFPTATFTRDGVQTLVDDTGTLQSAPAGIPAVEGLRSSWDGYHNNRPVLASIYEADTNFIGVAYDINTQTWERLGAARGMAVGELPSGIMDLAVLKDIRRVVLQDNGEVYKGIQWADFTKHEDGTDVDLTGGNGQIMVEYPRTYIFTYVDGDKYIIALSDQQLEGFTLHPAFEGASAIYRGAYEASVYDGKLCSISKDPADGLGNVYPVTSRAGDWGYSGLTTEATDTLAAARGTGWRQSCLYSASWERIIQLVAFASYNIPGIVGSGRSGLSGGAWENDSYIGPLGLGDASGCYYSAVQNGGSAGYLTDYAQVLGVENPWDHVWERVVSLISDHAVYAKADPPYDYSATTGWTRLLDSYGNGITLPTSNGYAGTPHSGLGIVLPADVTGGSTSGMFDYFYQDSGLRVLRVGGSANSGVAAGPFYWSAAGSAASAGAAFGGRLCFKKVIS